MKPQKIKVIAKGPYLVTGAVPLTEKIIVPEDCTYKYNDGAALPQSEAYALCRCGKSKNAPFCDGAHAHVDFNGEETAGLSSFSERAELIKGPGLDLLDDHRCALARFCHRRRGDAWELIQMSDNAEDRDEAIRAATECPAGRLTAVMKSGEHLEPEYEPELIILQDSEENVSGGIFVKGEIPIIAASGEQYELRSRAVLCRCGRSRNKPFCDGTHIQAHYRDKA